MADVNANIGVNIDTSAALGQLKDLQRQISQFHSSIAKSSQAAALAQRDLQKNFLNSVNSIGAFSAELRTVKTTSESFTSSLEKNKFSMREYFRYAGASTKTFGKLFKSEYDTIGKVAEDRVKKLQTQYIKMGRDASGAMKAIAITPNQLDMGNFATQTQIASQKQALFNQLMRQGSTNLLNFGKNTQWAGRQLMVGFTLPLMAVGAAASKSFMQMEAQALKFRKVYGDLFTPQEETQQALADIQELAKQFTKYGIAVADTVGLAADAAAAGFQGIDLQRQTTEATRLSVLGQIDNQQALETTIALQNAFSISSEELAQNIDFLNAVENQTVVSLDDITTAIPKVAPVIKQLGGDVKDLAFFLTAMKEGGINASEGANALKSGLASLINPSTRAREMLQGLGIDINGIVNNNKGDLKATVVGFAQALDTLAPLERARAIEQMFGKFQFARLSALFQNVTRDGTQASRVLELAGSSIEDLANLSSQELGKTADSAMNKFRKSVEDLKAAIVPVGEAFLKTVTPIIDLIGKFADKFSSLSDGTKKAITVMITVIGGLGPILLMTFGLLANGVANIIKLFLTLRTGYQRLTGQSQNLGEQTQYMTTEQLDNAAAAHSLNQAHATLTQQFTVEAEALQRLIAAYTAATSAAARFAGANPGMMVAPRARKKFAGGGIVRGPGGPKDDKVQIMASNGEAVVDAATVSANKPLIDELLSTGTFKPKVDVTGTPGNSARSSFSYSGVNRLIAGRGMPGATVGVPGNMPSVAAPVMKSGKYGQVPTGPDGKPAQYGHITTKIESTVDDFLKELLSLPAKLKAKRQTDINRLTGLQQAGGGQASVNSYTSLASWQSDTLNQAVGKGQSPVPTDMFVKDMEHFGTKMWIPALKDGGTTLKEVDAELTQYHSALKEAIVSKGKENKTGKITGQQYEKLEAELRKTLPSTSNLRKALDQAAAKIDEYRINIPANIAQNIKKNNPNLITGQGTHESLMTRGAGGNPTKIRLKGDRFKKADILGRQSLLSAQQAGQDLGTEATKGAAQGAATQSPSKKTIKVGEDIARGLAVGMQNQQSSVTRAGETLANGAVSGTRRAVRSQGAPRSLPMSQVSSQLVSAPQTEQQLKKFNGTLTQSVPRLATMNNALQGGSFALMSLSGMAQMFGGTLGKVSSVIFNVSGALFALQTVTQLLTQTQALKLIQDRLAIASQAAAFASYGAGAAGKSGLMGILSRFGIKLASFLGPIGIAAAVVGTFAIGIKLINDANARQREAIEGLGNAATLTEDKLKALGDFFGVVSRKSAFERGTTAKAGEVQVGSGARSQVESLKASDGFQEAFGKDINALKGATDKQAQLVFDSLAIDLKGKGYAKEQIQTIITAIQEEAGKTNIKFDVKSIDVSTKEGQDRMAKNVETLTKSLSNNLSKGMTTVYRQIYDPRTGLLITKPFKILSDGAKKNLNLVSKSITSMFSGLSGQLEAGIISADQFDSAFVRISNTIGAMPKAQALVLMENLLTSLPEKLRASALGIGNISSQLLLLKAQAAGVAVTAEIIAAMTTAEKASGPNAGGRKAKANDAIAEFEKKIAAAAAAYKKLNDAFTAGTVTGGGGTAGADTLSKEAKLTIARLQKELDGLKTKRDIINETNNELKRQYDYQQKLMQLSKDEVQAKISGDYIGASILGQQKSFETGQFNKETDNLALDKKIMMLENRISELQANARVSSAETALNKARAKGKAMGGLIKGPGTGTSDSILAKVGYANGGFIGVSNNEYIVKAASVQKYGVGFMNAVNNQQLSPVSANTSSSAGSTVYNIDMVINGGDAGTIADQVIRRLKIETSKNNKTNMVKY
jgi:TP901 family phage tail tape measure protein